MNDNRTVHAKCDNFEVVRYDRSGHWYVEPRSPGVRRQKVTIVEAVQRAEAAVVLGGRVNFDLPGGSTFDRLARRRGL